MRKIHGGEKGFTLVELLVVVGILAVLSGVATVAVTQFIGSGEDEAARTELDQVQSAVDAMMVKEGVTNLSKAECSEFGTPQNDMETFPGNSSYSLYPDYLRAQQTKHFYNCTDQGYVTGYYVDDDDSNASDDEITSTAP
ncbi:MAG: type II secretion system protein [Chloroflexota bacterium]